MTKVNHFGIVICPTHRGGHIEHAVELCTALAKATGNPVKLLSRPGARDYIGDSDADIEVLEIVPPLPRAEGRRIERILAYARSLVVEQIRVWRLARTVPGAPWIVLEEPRYPFPRLLTFLCRGGKSFVFVHNAVEHDEEASGLMAGVKRAIRSSSLRRSSGILTHGRDQRDMLRAQTNQPIIIMGLPSHLGVMPRDKSNHQIVRSDEFVCPGEIRPNKGLETAVAAARGSGSALRIAGDPVDHEYAKSVIDAVADVPSASLELGFLSRDRFDQLIAEARAVVLPYTSFSAQSGVLARAAALGTPVISADHPALREQAETLEVDIEWFAPGSSDELAAIFRGFDGEGARSRTPPNRTGQQPKWADRFARLIADD